MRSFTSRPSKLIYCLPQFITMKKISRVLLLALFMFSGVIAATAQTVDEVIDKHIAAIGGKDLWNKINSITLDGILNVQGTDINITLNQLHGKGMRQDIAVQGMKGFQIVTPTQGWMFMPFQGQNEVTAMSPEDVKRAQNELDTHGPLLNYKEKGHTAELAGKENINGAECYKLALTLNSGKKGTVFIDTKTYYVVRTIIKQQVSGQEQDVETTFSAFEKIPEGITVAKTLALPYGNMTITKDEINKPIDEKLFQPAYDTEISKEPK